MTDLIGKSCGMGKRRIKAKEGKELYRQAENSY